MRSTSAEEIAQEILDLCVAGHPPAELPAPLLDAPDGRALFGILVEGLADRFEPALCDIYADLFSLAVAFAIPGVDAASLVARYRRVRQVRPIEGSPRQIFVLSRITLGADVAITSVLMDAAKRRYPDARIVFVGPHKNYEIFAADPRISHAPVAYRRGNLRERLAVWPKLTELLSTPDSIVIDPDSRLTQLGLLPVCPEDRYYFFESRAYGADTALPLSQLAASWAAETVGYASACPALRLNRPIPSRQIAVSLGVGENPAKRLPDPFEADLLSLLATTHLPLCIDKGAGGEEAGRVECAVARSGVQPTFWTGSFAGFAGEIAASRLFVGYDSAGQHVAAACGIPLVTIFTGFPVPRMFDRWRPTAAQCRIIRVEGNNPHISNVLSLVQSTLRDLGMIS